MGIKNFIQGNCAKWDTHYGCVDGGCLVCQNKRCEYFEQSVFPICDPDYKHSHLTEQYKSVLTSYQQILPSFKTTTLRTCQCGNALPRRKRLCSDCRKKIDRENKRNWAAQRRKLSKKNAHKSL